MSSAIIHQSKNPTVIEVVRECDETWARAQALRKIASASRGAVATSSSSDSDEVDPNDIYELLAAEHPDLAKVYPAIVSSIACGEYSAAAAKKFFKYVQKNPWKSEEEFLDVQAAYSTILYRVLRGKKGAHTGAKDSAAIRTQARGALEATQKHMKEMGEKAKKTADARVARMERDRKDFLVDVLDGSKSIITEGEIRPIRVEYDSDG